MRIEIDIPDTFMPTLEQAAARDGVTPSEELLRLAQAGIQITDEERKKGDAAWERIKKRRKAMLARRGGVLFPDSTPLIRASRDEDH